MTNTPKPDLGFFGIAALVFAASTVVTVIWCGSMSSMPGMEMPGGWTMSMAWMRMPGQSWPGAAATFIGMWTVMMVAMMMPVLVPMLASYRKAMSVVGGARLGRLTMMAGAGYFTVWSLCGAMAFPFGSAIAQIAMRVPALSHAAPIAAGAVMVIAGALQFTSWKASQLECCRALPRGRNSGTELAAWKYGLNLGIRCVYCCLGLTALLLVIGVMDLRAMAVVTTAITAERLAPSGPQVARITGAVVIAAGLYSITRHWLIS